MTGSRTITMQTGVTVALCEGQCGPCSSKDLMKHTWIQQGMLMPE